MARSSACHAHLPSQNHKIKTTYTTNRRDVYGIQMIWLCTSLQALSSTARVGTSVLSRSKKMASIPWSCRGRSLFCNGSGDEAVVSMVARGARESRSDIVYSQAANTYNSVQLSAASGWRHGLRDRPTQTERTSVINRTAISLEENEIIITIINNVVLKILTPIFEG